MSLLESDPSAAGLASAWLGPRAAGGTVQGGDRVAISASMGGLSSFGEGHRERGLDPTGKAAAPVGLGGGNHHYVRIPAEWVSALHIALAPLLGFGDWVSHLSSSKSATRVSVSES